MRAGCTWQDLCLCVTFPECSRLLEVQELSPKLTGFQVLLCARSLSNQLFLTSLGGLKLLANTNITSEDGKASKGTLAKDPVWVQDTGMHPTWGRVPLPYSVQGSLLLAGSGRHCHQGKVRLEPSS